MITNKQEYVKNTNIPSFSNGHQLSCPGADSPWARVLPSKHNVMRFSHPNKQHTILCSYILMY